MRWIRFRDGAGRAAHADVDNAWAQPVEGLPFGDWLPPVQPSKVVELWKNSCALATRQQQAVPAETRYALRAPSSLSAHRQPVRAHLLGWPIANDVTAMELITRWPT